MGVEFSTQRETVLPKLAMVLPVVGKDQNDPITTHVLFRVSDSVCELLATNKKLVSRVGFKLSNSITTDVTFTLDGKKIADLLKRCQEGGVTFTYDEQEKTVEVLSEPTKTKIVLNSLDPKDFPGFEKDFEKADSLCEFKKNSLVAGLSFADSFVAGAKANDPKFTVASYKDGMFFAGTGRSIGLYQDDKFDKTKDFRVRGADIGPFKSWLKDCVSDDIECLESGNYLFFKSGNNFIGCVKTDIKPPPVNVPTTDDEPFSFNIAKDDLQGMIARLAVATASDNNRIDLAIEKDGDVMKATVKNEQGAESSETVEITPVEVGEDIKFGLDYLYLSAILDVMDNSVVVIRYEQKKNYTKFVADSDGAKAISFLSVLR